MPRNFDSLSTSRDLSLDKDYLVFLMILKERLHRARISASVAANTQLIEFYWKFGRYIVKTQISTQWESTFLKQLSRNTISDMRGFSNNLQHMKRFVQLHPKSLRNKLFRNCLWGMLSSLCKFIELYGYDAIQTFLGYKYEKI